MLNVFLHDLDSHFVLLLQRLQLFLCIQLLLSDSAKVSPQPCLYSLQFLRLTGLVTQLHFTVLQFSNLPFLLVDHLAPLLNNGSKLLIFTVHAVNNA
jgi:hypothetical protein